MSNQAHNVIVTGPAQKKTPCIHQSSSSTCPTSMSSCDLVRTQNLSQVKRLLRRQAPFSGPISIKLCEISAYFSFPIETWRKNRSGFVVWVAEVLGCWKSEQVLAVATGSGCSPAASPISLSTTPSGHRSASTITATSTTRRRLLPRVRRRPQEQSLRLQPVQRRVEDRPRLERRRLQREGAYLAGARRQLPCGQELECCQWVLYSTSKYEETFLLKWRIREILLQLLIRIRIIEILL